MPDFEEAPRPIKEPGEMQIPACIIEFRLEHPVNRPMRNPDYSAASSRADTFKNIRFEDAGDGYAYVICNGDDRDCEGTRVKVDRHDLIQPGVPETTVKLGGLCTAKYWYQRTGQLLQQYELADD